MNQRTIIAIVIAVALLALIGTVAFMSQQTGQTPTENQTQTPPPASNGNDSGQDGSNQTQNQTEPADEAQSGEVSATISGNAFQPASLTIKKGTKVTWTNNDSVEHTVTADTTAANAPDSPQLDQGDTYSFTFNDTGTFAYHCTPHPNMKATVTVVE